MIENRAGSEPREPAWLEQDRRFVWHPYTQTKTAPAPIPIERGDGVYLVTPEGRRILDGISSWWVNIHGHNHPRLNLALRRQAERVAQVIFAGFAHEPAATLAAELCRRSPAGLGHVFFSDDGSTAVEVALKMAYQSFRNRGETRRRLFVALEHAYHGDTFGAMAAGGTSAFHATFHDLFFEVRRAHAPYCLRCPVGKVRESCGIECADSLENILTREGKQVAAIVIEPMVQAAGGMIVWPTQFLVRVRELATAHGVPLVADEVFTGFGRTGRMFACEHGPIRPDILCLSKALTGGYLPLAATLTTDVIYESFLSDDRAKTFFHGHSYTGNALACAVALESLAVFDDERVLDRVAQLESLFQMRLESIRSIHCVAETRCLGAIAVIELKGASSGGYLDEMGPRLYRELLQRDLLLRPLGNVLYFLPPYGITDEQVHGVFDVIGDVLAGF